MVIDLGDGDWEVHAPPPRATLRSRARLVRLVVVAALVLTMAGSARPPWQLGPPLWWLEVRPLSGGPAILVLGGSLYTWDGTAVIGRDPLTTATRWRVDVPGNDVSVFDVGVPGIVAITSYGESASSGPDGETVRFVDAATGRVRLALSAYASGAPTGDPDIVMVQQSIVNADCLSLQPCFTYAGYSLSTGERRWIVPYDPAAQVLVDSTAQTIAVLTDDGDLTVRRQATGEIVSRWQVEWRSTGPDGEQSVALVGGTLVIAHQDGDVTLHATAVGPGGATWTRQVSPPAGDAHSQLNLGGCGAVLCLFDGVSTWSIDPVTGETQTQDLARPGAAIPADDGVYFLIGDPARSRDVVRLSPDGTQAILGTVANVSNCWVVEYLLICDGYEFGEQGTHAVARAWQLR